MRRWMSTFTLRVAAATAISIVFIALGYRVDWPTFVYTSLAFFVVDGIREAAE